MLNIKSIVLSVIPLLLLVLHPRMSRGVQSVLATSLTTYSCNEVDIAAVRKAGRPVYFPKR
jgi:hypothetical protein